MPGSQKSLKNAQASSKKAAEIICYDATSRSHTLTQMCPVCFNKQEFVCKTVPEMQIVFVECCSKSKK